MLPGPTQGPIDRSRQVSTQTNHNPTHLHTQLTSATTPDERLRCIGAIDRLLWQSQELAARVEESAVPFYVMATGGRIRHFLTEGGSRLINMEVVEASGCVVD